ncbi:hypothetical protein J5839_03990 [Methanosarcinaceae archaeon]|nr:hypothetical protein [Methanosarcinaceae archaeon]MBQ3621202.1 hypothetical protein [Methanosarcinaceae archaeon]
MSEKIEVEKYTDKYFLRTYDILQKEGLNPFVRAQVFVRKGPGTMAGSADAVSFIRAHSDIEKHGGRIYALEDGKTYDPLETLLLIEAPVLDIVRLETLYLGIISSSLARLNDHAVIDPAKVRENMKQITDAAEGRPVTYFGARHWHYSEDALISEAAVNGGACGASTDIGAAFAGKKGVGTIPHILETIFEKKYGRENAVCEATLAFDRDMDPAIPRIALIDYRNHEIDDALAVVRALPSLDAVRIDTCGENIGQGALSFDDLKNRDGSPLPEDEIDRILEKFFGRNIRYSDIPESDREFWFGHGVTVTGVYAVKEALLRNGYDRTGVMLTSGFGNPEKVRAFARAEKMTGVRLFDSLGVGGIFESRDATMDVVSVGDSIDDMTPVSKAGRCYRPNPRLTRVL